MARDTAGVGTSKPTLASLARKLGASFADQALLQRALVHKSYLNEQPDATLESYERLEYLGDAYLSYAVAAELYQRFPAFDEGALTRARSALVQGTALAEIARSLRLGRYLVLGQGEERSEGRARASNLAGVLEALIGAVLLDQGEDAARALVLRLLGKRLHAMTEGPPRDVKSALQAYCQRAGMPLPVYELLADRGPQHARRFQVRVFVASKPAGTGSGPRKVDAEFAAAVRALTSLQRAGPAGPRPAPTAARSGPATARTVHPLRLRS